MNKTLRLIHTMLKMQYSMAGKSTGEKLGYLFLLLFLVPFAFIFISLMNSIVATLYQQLAPTGNENALLGLLFVGITFILFFVSLSSILSSFYFAEDIEGFIPYPFHPYQLLAGKAAAPFISLYLTSGVLMVPILTLFGIHSGASFIYYLYAFILFIIFPVVPFTVVAIILMFFMRYANIAKNKDRTKVFAGLLSFVFIIGFNIIIRLNQDPGQTAEGAAALIQEQNGLLDLITGMVPTAYFSTMALNYARELSGLLFLLLMLAISTGAVLLFLLAGQKLYFKGILGLTAGSRKTFDPHKVTRKIKHQPVVAAMIKKELRIIFRTPTFFMQCVVQSLFAPVFLIVILLFESSSSSFSMLGTMLGQFQGKTSLLLLFVFSLFILGVNPASYSSISRDGRNWPANLYLPVHPEAVIFSKAATAWLINLLSILLLAIIGIAVLNMPPGLFALWVGLTLLASWFTSLVGTALDLNQPKLHWTDEQEVFKSRLISLFALLIEMGAFGFIVIIIWNIDAVEGLWMTALLLALLLAGAIAISHVVLKRLIRTHYHNTI
ncbi:ABC-2 type transport system permease protein [Thalassobacillus cyri]|uniref:ABC-2 type transport system permease protein n=1 Tax=Thalassobacillus cyri TaxID=571932 RepID=A0A1H4HGG4_9BACI|nr:ABC transporter permease [Thalassobacillus cyri]SEB20726.1 ABC-2 type transport system permease protein [Thalassobacillus cyri]